MAKCTRGTVVFFCAHNSQNACFGIKFSKVFQGRVPPEPPPPPIGAWTDFVWASTYFTYSVRKKKWGKWPKKIILDTDRVRDQWETKDHERVCPPEVFLGGAASAIPLVVLFALDKLVFDSDFEQSWICDKSIRHQPEIVLPVSTEVRTSFHCTHVYGAASLCSLTAMNNGWGCASSPNQD